MQKVDRVFERYGWVGILLVVGAMTFRSAGATAEEAELYEVRHYLLGDDGDEAALDAFLKDALIPALARQGIETVGAFAYPRSMNSKPKDPLPPRVILVIPYASASQVASVAAALQKDEAYRAAGKGYLDREHDDLAFDRIESELLVAMDCMKKMSVPPGTLDNTDRVYEFRLYESANERLGTAKVDMFNNGEVPIFLDCGIQPIFIGESLIGPYRPSLSYLTVYENDAARIEAWKAFRVHPDWQVLKQESKYANTVSRIDKLILKPKPYSKM